MAPPAVVAPAVVWTDNPYTSDFNPGTSVGQKIFLEKTKGLPSGERFALTSGNSKGIMDFLKVKEQILGKAVTAIPTAYPGGVPSERMNLVYQSLSITLEMTQRAAHQRFGTAIGEHDPIPNQPWATAMLDPGAVPADQPKFYDRVHGNVVVELIKNILTPGAWDDLMLQELKFGFTDTLGTKSYDGPTMLKVLLEEIDPTSSVNIELHRQAIEATKLHEFKGNLPDMLKSIEKHHQVIVGNGFHYDSDTYRRHILSALQSGPNAVFNTKIQAIKSDVDAGHGYNSDITPQALLMSSKQLYNNISRRGEWNKVDPKDAQILALTTALKTDKPAPTFTKGDQSSKFTGEKTVPGMDTLAVWRTKKVGDTLVKSGTTYHWCTHHKSEKFGYDGLYYASHDDASHDEWKQSGGGNRARIFGANAKVSTSESTTKSKSSHKDLQISEALKTALCTNLCVSEEDIDKIIKSTSQEN